MLAFSHSTLSIAASPGVYSDRIVVGGVMDLEGHSRGLGLGMQEGVRAAFKDVKVQGRRLEFITANDSYTPDLTVKQTQRMIDEGAFVMLGNVGTPTAKVALPILAQNKVPAVGFFTGAGLLRPGEGDVVNFRASYIQETAAVISQGIQAGLEPQEICAYVQNDAYGMAGVEGIRQALRLQSRSRNLVKTLDQVLEVYGENPARNGLGPVGVYERNTLTSRAGYESLKHWESQQGARCKLVVTVGTYNAIARFAAYSRSKGEDWLISAVSFTGADVLGETLEQFGVKDRVIVTQVVPDLHANIPLINQARKDLGDRFSYVSLEGYIVGKMFVAMLEKIPGEITRDAFMQVVKNSKFDVGGIVLDFQGDNQGSDLVTVTYYKDKKYQAIGPDQWREIL
ncbi:MAG: ABC transporter substrate-binding protein [Hahellaceae bacterium]|nr:ABC transporter substrate-binding protein [Hahellaceae bacterium]MCP5168964.1 ABC transporter substrate-binding protein [Hahellaceae bacterium]